jgi:hypothetical protein
VKIKTDINMEKNQMIIELVTDSINKVKSQAENNGKILTEKHNTMNWFLTFVAILFTFFTSKFNSEFTSCPETCLIFLSKIIFVLIVVTFVFYKIIHVKFLKKQICLYNSLDTHHLELKYNINKLNELYDFKDLGDSPFIFNVVDFINSFTSADFRFYKNHDTRDVVFKKLYNKISLLSKYLNITYFVIFTLFSIYIFLAIILMF